jgi:hypothetical protein
MIVLEQRFYSLAEVKKLMDTNRKETITNNLTKWGYHYEWITRKGVNIIEIPNITNPEIQLRSLLMRKLDLDIQTDFKAFSAFFFKVMDDDLFLASPWGVKAKVLKDEFGIEVSDRTLRSYNSKLAEKGFIFKNNEKSKDWCTFYLNGEKYQEVVGNFEPIRELQIQSMEEWFTKRKQYLLAADLEYSKTNGVQGLMNPDRWTIAFKRLWKETGIVYYSIKGWSFNGFKDKELQEIYKLTTLVVADIEPPEKSGDIITELIREQMEEKMKNDNFVL